MLGPSAWARPARSARDVTEVLRPPLLGPGRAFRGGGYQRMNLRSGPLQAKQAEHVLENVELLINSLQGA